MFIISDSTIILGKENVRSIAHLEHCLSNKTLHERPLFSFFGARVRKGSVLVHTADGDRIVTFRAQDGIASEICILPSREVE